MILFCQECHRTHLQTHAEVAHQGGPSAFRCEVCQRPLTTLEAGLGLPSELVPRREQTQPDGLAMVDDDGGGMSPDDEPTHLRPAFNPQGDGGRGLADSAAYQDAESTQLNTPAASASAGRPHLSGRLTGEQDIPEDFLRSDSASSMPRRTGSMAAVGRPGSPQASYTTALPVLQINEQYGMAAHAAPAPAEAPQRSGGLMLGIGCAVLVLGGLLAAAVIGGMFYFRSEEGGTMMLGGGGGGEPPVSAPARASLADRLLEASSAVPNTAVPAVRFSESPQEGEVLVVSSVLWHNGKSLANINLGRVEANARPNPESPFIVPLADSLEASFAAAGEAPEDDSASRWVVVLADGKATYRALYEVLYTAWNRGARLQLGTTNPMNPNAFLAVEVIPVDWPDPVLTDVPDRLEERRSEAIVDPSLKAMHITIEDRGFLVRPPGKKAEEAVLVEKTGSSWPTSSLRSKLQELRAADPTLGAVLVVPAVDTTAFTLLQTLGACLDSSKEAPLGQLRLAPPAARK